MGPSPRGFAEVGKEIVVGPGFSADEESGFAVGCRGSYEHAGAGVPVFRAQAFFEAAVPDHFAPDAAVYGVVDVLQELAVDAGIDRVDDLGGVDFQVDGLGAKGSEG